MIEELESSLNFSNLLELYLVHSKTTLFSIEFIIIIPSNSKKRKNTFPMATLSLFSYSPLNTTNSKTIITNNKNFNTHSSFLSLHSKKTKTTSSFKLFSSLKDENETNSSPVSIAPKKQDNISSNNNDDVEHDVGRETNEDEKEQQEMDWKTDEEFKKFMGNPSIEAAIKLEKKRTDRKLKELDTESSKNNPIVGVFNNLVRRNLIIEKERLQKAEETFRALDLNKVSILIISVKTLVSW
jgi:hypothetical protein